MGDTLATYPSSSNPAKSYRIIRGGDGVVYCDCPGWKMRKSCKHLVAYHAGAGTVPTAPAVMGAPAKKAKAVKSGITLPTSGSMLGLDPIDPAVFASDDFQTLPFYQGCGSEIDSDRPEDIAEKLDKYEVTGKWVAERKADGINISVFSDGKRNRFWSRNSLEKEYGLANSPLPAGTLVVGELGAGSEHALERRTKLGDFVDIHSILVLDYKPLLHLSETERRTVLEDWHSKLPKDLQKHFLLMPRWTSDFKKHYQDEHEGLVLKSIDGGPYVGRKTKPAHWMKAKKWMEADMVLMDITLSKAVTKDKMTEAVICGQYVDGKLKELVRVGSMSSQWSLKFAADFAKYRGKVISVAHFGQFKSGSLRHPSMINLRDDKDASECVFDPNASEDETA